MVTPITAEYSRDYRPAVSWGAVFGGWLFATAVALLLYLFGAAAGVTTLAALNDLSAGVAWGTGIWVLLSWAIATFMGAVLAARLAGRTDRTTGVMHGLIVWALSGVMTLIVGGIQATSMAALGVGAGTQMAQAAGQAAPEGGGALPEPIRQSLRNQMEQQAAQVASQAAGPEVTQADAQAAVQQLNDQAFNQIAAALISGDTQQAQQILSSNTNLSQDEAGAIIGGMSANVQSQIGQLQRGAGEAAEQAGDVAGAALWVMFLLSLVGLAAGAYGGFVGAAWAESIHPHVQMPRFPEEVEHEEAYHPAGHMH